MTWFLDLINMLRISLCKRILDDHSIRERAKECCTLMENHEIVIRLWEIRPANRLRLDS